MDRLAFFVAGSSLVFASVFWLLRPQRVATPARRILHRRATRVGITVFVPAVVVVLYAWLGHIDALTPPPPDPARALAEQRTARLASRLENDRDDVRGLRLLARSYESLRRVREAIAIRERLVALQPEDPDALVDLADTVSTTQGGSYVGEPIALVMRALTIDADHARGLASAANEAAARGDLVAAIAYWERLAARSVEDVDLARSIRTNIDRARADLATPGGPTARQ